MSNFLHKNIKIDEKCAISKLVHKLIIQKYVIVFNLNKLN